MRALVLLALLLAAPAAAQTEAELVAIDQERTACRRARDWVCAFEKAQALYRADFERFAGQAADPEGRRLMVHLSVGLELALDARDTALKERLTGELFWTLLRFAGTDWRAHCFLICIARAEALADTGDLAGGAEFARTALNNADRLVADDWVYPSAIHLGEMDAVIITRGEATDRLDALAVIYDGRL